MSTVCLSTWSSSSIGTWGPHSQGPAACTRRKRRPENEKGAPSTARGLWSGRACPTGVASESFSFSTCGVRQRYVGSPVPAQSLHGRNYADFKLVTYPQAVVHNSACSDVLPPAMSFIGATGRMRIISMKPSLCNNFVTQLVMYCFGLLRSVLLCSGLCFLGLRWRNNSNAWCFHVLLLCISLFD